LTEKINKIYKNGKSKTPALIRKYKLIGKNDININKIEITKKVIILFILIHVL